MSPAPEMLPDNIDRGISEDRDNCKLHELRAERADRGYWPGHRTLGHRASKQKCAV